MGMLADRVDYVIGVDTHRDSHAVAVCAPTGAVIAETTVAADVRGVVQWLLVAPGDVGDRPAADRGPTSQPPDTAPGPANPNAHSDMT